MRIRAAFTLVVITAAALFVSRAGVESHGVERTRTSIPQFVKAAASGVSPSVRSIARPPTKLRPADGSGLPVRVMEADTESESEADVAVSTHDRDGALATFSATPMPTPLASFDGLSNFDNIDAYDALIIPPDTIGDVGPSHYVQSANSLFRVFDKNGNPLTPPFKLSSLFAPLDTICSTRNDGDPSIVYDPLADRWVLSQYCTAFPPFRQMIAVSTTGDPTGEYFVYEFVMPNVRLNDYAKLSVWPDGYYMSTDEFYGSDYVGSGAFAFDRQKMLSGDPSAGYIYFDLPNVIPTRAGGILPADLDGLAAPPPGVPNIFVGYSANEYGEAQDAIRLFDFHADFAEPSNSTFHERPESPLAVAAFDPTSPPDRTDIMQPAPGTPLDSVSDRLMYRIAYRNFGDHETLVFNQTVRTTSQSETYRAGVRVYELRRAPSAAFSVVEQVTLGDATSSRWLGAAAQDNRGDLAVGYSFVNDGKKPSVLYSGRSSTDPPGLFRDEETLVIGTGVQKAFGSRWGDYSTMTVDPSDDCTFWIANEYYTQASEDFSDFTWLTRIGKFKFPECVPVSKSAIDGTITDAVSGQPITNANVVAAAYSRSSNAAGSYGDLLVVPGSYSLTVSAAGYETQAVSISVSAGQTLTRNFALQPIPVIETAPIDIVSESCGLNHAAEPGETVTANIGLRNTGRATALDLNATLQPTGGIVETSASQNYGTLPLNGAVVTRPFTFKVSPATACGSAVSLSFALTSGGQPVGIVAIPLRAGEVRYALRENFDRGAFGRLPFGWTTTASGVQLPWAPSRDRSSSTPSSLFSPDPKQVGLNEVDSPFVQITSTSAKLTFQNWYDLETTFLRNRLYDGSVLETSIDGGAWQDIVDAGGVFESGGYDEGLIDSCCQNPLAGRHGWSGRSGVNQTSEFITTSVRLPPSLAGHTARFRWRVGTDIGTFREGQYIDDVTLTDGYSCSCANVPANRAPFDFDGDGRTDLSVFRPNDVAGAPDFVIQDSSNGTLNSSSFGSVGDLAANADFDDDRRTDIAVFRPSTGDWYILRSSDHAVSMINFGLAGDRPVPSDYDGDGRADIAVYRPSNGTWYLHNSSNGEFSAHQFGIAEDVPVPGDYDGDGKTDIAVWRPSSGVWYVDRSSDAANAITQFGLTGDKPVPGDFDGDGKTDLAVFRPSNGTWYLLRSSLGFGAVQFGIAGDAPLQADFDGDRQNDVAVFRPSTAVWYYVRSSDGAVVTQQFGSTGDTAVPSIFVANQ